jgi:hypothetical protein
MIQLVANSRIQNLPNEDPQTRRPWSDGCDTRLGSVASSPICTSV